MAASIDAGWYADGPWWDSVGLWLPSPRRFPAGIEQVLSAIKERGMIPGLWLGLEVVGINSPLAREVPDDWFFCRHGKRIIDHGRYQLDFRNPQVRAHADQVLHRLVSEYGVGYIKMDYPLQADTTGDLPQYPFLAARSPNLCRPMAQSGTPLLSHHLPRRLAFGKCQLIPGVAHQVSQRESGSS